MLVADLNVLMVDKFDLMFEVKVVPDMSAMLVKMSQVE